jgi:hypothetical protein
VVVRSGTIHKYIPISDTSAEFAALFTADIVTPQKPATAAPGYPIFFTVTCRVLIFNYVLHERESIST